MNTMHDVLQFWFEELTPEQHFSKNSQMDEKIRERFYNLYQQAARGELKTWRQTPEGRLAEIIVLDQFPRNMFRDSAQAFATDALALQLSQEAVREKADQRISIKQRAFLYMPYMHSEDPKRHEDAVVLFSQPGLENNLKFEYMHKKIIDRFGRYPHRNAVLGRTSTAEEMAFLKEEGSSF